MHFKQILPSELLQITKYYIQFTNFITNRWRKCNPQTNSNLKLGLLD